VVKHPKPHKNLKIAFSTDLSQRCPPQQPPPPYYSTRYVPLHSYLLENNQKVALPQQVELKMELLHFHYRGQTISRYQSAKIGDYYSGIALLIITLFLLWKPKFASIGYS